MEVKKNSKIQILEIKKKFQIPKPKNKVQILKRKV
jgi:hypothetical protein